MNSVFNVKTITAWRRGMQRRFIPTVNLAGLGEIIGAFIVSAFTVSIFTWAHEWAVKNCKGRPYFKSFLRGIGKSFQSAITAPRVNLTCYGNATAQS